MLIQGRDEGEEEENEVQEAKCHSRSNSNREERREQLTTWEARNIQAERKEMSFERTNRFLCDHFPHFVGVFFPQ